MPEILEAQDFLKEVWDMNYNLEMNQKYYDAIKESDSDFLISSHYTNLDGDIIKTNIINTDAEILSFYPLENQETFNKLSYHLQRFLNDYHNLIYHIFQQILIVDF